MDLPDLINKVVYHTESYNPSIISNGLATFLLSRAAYKDGLKVVLSGDGADELFCGYPLSKNALDWFEKKKELIENMHFTELRRLDLASMANTIEIRCPFLDRMVYAASLDCTLNDLIIENNEELKGKYILREIFKNDLPKEILERNKMSFDVGSGIRKLVVESLSGYEKIERMALKPILEKYFQSSIISDDYFHAYPIFDNSIDKRGIIHK
jgi:asparagine synthase (glutamine-hydrolysing)